MTSAPVRSGVTVNAGELITSVTGASLPISPATTRSRRSRSVTMPSFLSDSRTSAALASASAMLRAASRTLQLESAITGRP